MIFFSAKNGKSRRAVVTDANIKTRAEDDPHWPRSVRRSRWKHQSVAHFHMSQDNRLAQKGWRLFKIEKSYFEYRDIKIRDEILL